jgi:hypothetical protein
MTSLLNYYTKTFLVIVGLEEDPIEKEREEYKKRYKDILEQNKSKGYNVKVFVSTRLLDKMDQRIPVSTSLLQKSSSAYVTGSNGPFEHNQTEVSIEMNVKALIMATLQTQRNFINGDALQPFTIYELIDMIKESASDGIRVSLDNPNTTEIARILLDIPNVHKDESTNKYFWIPEKEDLKKQLSKMNQGFEKNRYMGAIQNWSRNNKDAISNGLIELVVMPIFPKDFEDCNTNASTNEVRIRKKSPIHTVWIALKSMKVPICLKVLDPTKAECFPLYDSPEMFETLDSPTKAKYLKGYIYCDLTFVYE